MRTTAVGLAQQAERAGRGSPIWALDLILVPILEKGLQEGHVKRLRGRRDAETVRELRRVFGCGIILLREERSINLPHLAGPTQLSEASVRTLLERIEDWNWLVDNLRLAASDHGAAGHFRKRFGPEEHAGGAVRVEHLRGRLQEHAGRGLREVERGRAGTSP